MTGDEMRATLQHIGEATVNAAKDAIGEDSFAVVVVVRSIASTKLATFSNLVGSREDLRRDMVRVLTEAVNGLRGGA